MILGLLTNCFLCVCVCWQVVPDSDAHRAGLQEGDQVLSVNEVDFQDIEHSRVSKSSAFPLSFIQILINTLLYLLHLQCSRDTCLCEMGLLY